MKISRKFERTLVYLLGTWQIIDGLITILFYGIPHQHELVDNSNILMGEIYTLEIYFGDIYNFIIIFGLLLIGLGLINLILAKNYILNTNTNFKIGVWLIFIGIFSYFIMDIISVLLSISAGIIFLAKNKSLKASIKK